MGLHARLMLPTGLVVANTKRWEHASTNEDQLPAVLIRISELWDSGLMTSWWSSTTSLGGLPCYKSADA